MIDEKRLRAAFDGEMPKVYLPSAFMRGCCFVCALICATAALSIAVWFVLAKTAPLLVVTTLALVVMMACITGAVLATLGGFRWATALTERRIGAIGIFNVQTMLKRDVAGLRDIPTQYGPRSVKLFSKLAGMKPLSIALFSSDARLLEWLHALPDLDRIDQEAITDALLARPDLGATPADRRLRVERVNRVAKIADLAGYAVALWGFIAPIPYDLVVLLLAAAPVAGIVLIWWSCGIIAMGLNRSDPRPGLAGLFCASPLVLAMRALVDNQLVDWSGPTIVSTAIALLTGTWVAWRRGKAGFGARIGTGLVVTLVAFLAIWGAVIEANVLIDTAPPEIFRPMILGKAVYRDSRNTSYKVKLEPWGPYSEPTEVEVKRGVYDSVDVGLHPCVHLHGGAFKVRWFSVRPC